jgi:4-amino-4-deoxy-L-arabinose transferase-like glycosyltransferase
MKSAEQNDTPCHSSWWPDVVLLVVACGLVLWLGLGSTRLWDQDEGYYASVAREMYDRQDWVVPTFNQELFAHKPPLMYWGMLAGFHLFGVCEFAARWLSAVLGTGMVLLTYRLGRLLVDRKAALIAALALVSSLMFTLAARSATADAHLGFFVLLAINLWVSAAKSSDETLGPHRTDLPNIPLTTWLLIYLAIAFAVLSKGPIGFAFPIAILGTLTLMWPWICGQNASLWQGITPKRFLRATRSMQPFAGSIVLLLVAAPWFWIVNERTNGAFLVEFFGVQHLERFSKPMDNHSGPIYYYLVSILLGFFPWTSFAIPIGLHAYQTHWQRPQRLLCSVLSVWLFFYLVVFSLASTKLPNYIIPAYPAVALWIGIYFASWMQTDSGFKLARRFSWPIAGWSFMILSGLIAGGITILLGLPQGVGLVERLELDPAILPTIARFGWLAALLIAGGLAGLMLHRRNQGVWGTALLSAVCVVWVGVLWQVIIPAIDRFQTPQQIATEYIAPHHTVRSPIRQYGSDGQPAIVGMFRPSMVFYSKGRLNFCSDERALEQSLTEDPPSLVVVNQSSDQAERMLDAHGYRLADSLASFPKRGEIRVYRK